MYVAMQVWLLMLNCNRGLHFTYILNAIPTKHLYTCGDAALMGVVGGYAKYKYFPVSSGVLSHTWAVTTGTRPFPGGHYIAGVVCSIHRSQFLRYPVPSAIPNIALQQLKCSCRPLALQTGHMVRPTRRAPSYGLAVLGLLT